MKKLCLLLLTTLTFSTQAQNLDHMEYMGKVLIAYEKSYVVQSVKREVEKEFQVKCTTRRVATSWFGTQLVYKANCENQANKLKLKIFSMWEDLGGGNFNFNLYYYQTND